MQRGSDTRTHTHAHSHIHKRTQHTYVHINAYITHTYIYMTAYNTYAQSTRNTQICSITSRAPMTLLRTTTLLWRDVIVDTQSSCAVIYRRCAWKIERLRLRWMWRWWEGECHFSRFFFLCVCCFDVWLSSCMREMGVKVR